MTELNIIDVIARSPWFFELPKAASEIAAQAAVRRLAPAGTYIYQLGKPTTEVCCILSGRVRMSLQSPNGQEFALIEREAQEWLGEPCLVNDDGRVVEAQTIERTELLIIPRDVMLSIGQQYPLLYRNLFHYSQQTLRGLHELIGGILFYPLKARVAGRLLHFVEEHGKEVEEGVQLDIKVSQNDFARLALGSRQRVNKIFRDWANRGLVELRDEYLLVLDVEALEAEIDLFE